MEKTPQELNKNGLILLQARKELFAKFYFQQSYQNTLITSCLKYDYANFAVVGEYSAYLTKQLISALEHEDGEIPDDIMVQIGVLLAYCCGIETFYDQLATSALEYENILSEFIDICKEFNMGIIIELTQYSHLDLHLIAPMINGIYNAQNVKDFLSRQETYGLTVKNIVLDDQTKNSELFKTFILYFFSSQAVMDYFCKFCVSRC